MYEPVIKWAGSKRSQAEEILKYFPKEIDTYYEPFCGGCSVLMRLLETDIRVNKFVCSDKNKDLIDLWCMIRDNPEKVSEHYSCLWNEMVSKGDVDNRRDYFNSVRDRYNKNHNPLDFFFIMRTCTNGLPRYNKSGQFNNSYHLTRLGMKPETLHKIIFKWSEKIQGIVFQYCDYSDIIPTEGDFMYLDPPYANTKGMYFCDFDISRYFEWLRTVQCDYIFSFDGKAGGEDRTYNVPCELYTRKGYIESGKSSFRKLYGVDSVVHESIYIYEHHIE